MQPDLSKEELREVARRPAGGSPMNFLRDLKSLFSFQALKATVQSSSATTPWGSRRS